MLIPYFSLVSKIWLETHIWHAKRMHMTEIWGHRLVSLKIYLDCFFCFFLFDEKTF